MTNVVNLRRARKNRARADAEARAAANRAVHGRSRAYKDAAAAEQERTDRHLDGTRREREPDHPRSPDPGT